jgi:tetratricopeptide (TPR) repeat protein
MGKRFGNSLILITFMGSLLVWRMPYGVAAFHNNLGAVDMLAGLTPAENRRSLRAAEKEFEIAARWNPQQDSIWWNLGLARYLAGNETGAVGAWQHAPRWSTTSLIFRGRVAEKKSSDLHSGLTWFALAAKVQPQSSEAHYWLGKVYAEKGEFALAQREFEQSAKYDPENADTLIALASLAFENTRDLDSASATLLTAMEIDPKNERAYHAMATLYARSQRWAEAVIWWEIWPRHTSPRDGRPTLLLLTNVLRNYVQTIQSRG